MTHALVVEFGDTRRCLSSAVLGGGLHAATHWLNLQVDHGYERLDPDVHLACEARSLGLEPGTVIGMLTAADVGAAQTRRRGPAGAHATVGISQPLAAAGRRPRRVARVGTINLLVLVDATLSDAALAGAIQTATEAKAQALADAGVAAANHPGPATGTATDSICIAALPGPGEPFAGPATVVGAAIAGSVHDAILAGAQAHRRIRSGLKARR
jgi:adenosylcobinamide hydrolase